MWYHLGMHVRFSSCVGLPLMEEGMEGVLGTVSGILIHPDTAYVEGFFVYGSGHGRSNLFVSSMDISRWGTRLYVRNADVIAPADDRIRLQALLEDNRTVLGQRIVTESGVRVGRCKDVQINTDSMHIEWIFPKKCFRWGVALPVSEVIEVTVAAIIIKDRLKAEKPRKNAKMSHGSFAELSDAPLAGRTSH
jgi:sporulation protein YlmC with PRC-barrel domain